MSTVIGQIIGSVVPILHFLRSNDSLLRLVKPTLDGKTILETCTNGSSELKSLYRKSLIIIGAGSVLLTAVGIIFAAPIAGFFVGYDLVLLKLSQRAFALYSVSFF